MLHVFTGNQHPEQTRVKRVITIFVNRRHKLILQTILRQSLLFVPKHLFENPFLVANRRMFTYILKIFLVTLCYILPNANWKSKSSTFTFLKTSHPATPPSLPGCCCINFENPLWGRKDTYPTFILWQGHFLLFCPFATSIWKNVVSTSGKTDAFPWEVGGPQLTS